jgi:hypothetical protein
MASLFLPGGPQSLSCQLSFRRKWSLGSMRVRLP